MCAHRHTHKNAHPQTQIHQCVHACTPTKTYTQTCAYMHTHTGSERLVYCPLPWRPPWVPESCGSIRCGPTQACFAPLGSLIGYMTHSLAPHDSVYTSAWRSSQLGWGGLWVQPEPASLSSQHEHFIPLLAQSRSWHPWDQQARFLEAWGQEVCVGGGGPRSGALQGAEKLGDKHQPSLA